MKDFNEFKQILQDNNAQSLALDNITKLLKESKLEKMDLTAACKLSAAASYLTFLDVL